MNGPGRFVVVEGLDGAGTTTQSAALAAWCRGRGLEVEATCEPSDGPVGRAIRATLAGAPEAPAPATLPWMFAADRADHLARTIEPALSRGAWVVSDRYVPSSLAYQSLTLPIAEVFALNRHFRAPDLTVFLDVDIDVAVARIARRGARPELFEDRAQLARIRAGYDAALGLLAARGDRVIHLAGAEAVDVVAARIQAAAALLGA